MTASETIAVLNPKDDYRAPYVYNPLYTTEPKHLRSRGHLHVEGRCGYMGSLCGDCHEIQIDWHVPIAIEIGRAFPALESEHFGDYWRRVGGHFNDTWVEAATIAMKLGK